MPETSVDQDHGAVPGEHEVGGAGKISAVEPKTEAESMRDAANDHLRLGVEAPDPGHDLATFCTVHGVDHRAVRRWNLESAISGRKAATYHARPPADHQPGGHASTFV